MRDVTGVGFGSYHHTAIEPVIINGLPNEHKKKVIKIIKTDFGFYNECYDNAIKEFAETAKANRHLLKAPAPLKQEESSKWCLIS